MPTCVGVVQFWDDGQLIAFIRPYKCGDLLQCIALYMVYTDPTPAIMAPLAGILMHGLNMGAFKVVLRAAAGT